MLLYMHIHSETAAKCEVQLQLRQEGSICAECYENFSQAFSLYAGGKKVQSHQQRNKLIILPLPVGQDQIHFMTRIFL